MNAKSARQSGWSLHYSENSFGEKFVTAFNDQGTYCEFTFDKVNRKFVPGTANDIPSKELPRSVLLTIRYWFGMCDTLEYTQEMNKLFQS